MCRSEKLVDKSEREAYCIIRDEMNQKVKKDRFSRDANVLTLGNSLNCQAGIQTWLIFILL